MPVEPMESMLRPFNLVIPFTVQKGELTGTALGTRGRRGPLSRPSLRDENWGPERGSEHPRSCSKWGRAGTQTQAFGLPVQGSVHHSRLVPNLGGGRTIQEWR